MSLVGAYRPASLARLKIPRVEIFDYIQAKLSASPRPTSIPRLKMVKASRCLASLCESRFIHSDYYVYTPGFSRVETILTTFELQRMKGNISIRHLQLAMPSASALIRHPCWTVLPISTHHAASLALDHPLSKPFRSTFYPCPSRGHKQDPHMGSNIDQWQLW